MTFRTCTLVALFTCFAASAAMAQQTNVDLRRATQEQSVSLMTGQTASIGNASAGQTKVVVRGITQNQYASLMAEQTMRVGNASR